MKTLILLLLPVLSFAQVFQCGTKEPPNTLIITPQASRMLAADNTIRTIPLVFHFVWNPTLNPQDSALLAAKVPVYLDIMQKFARKRNADTSQTVAQFRSVMADAKIEFCLKQVIYKRTTETTFTTDDRIKYAPIGSNAIDPVKHCNVWFGRLAGSLGGYAYFPTPTAVGQSFDGLVILGNPIYPDDQIAEIIIHELGHYLSLYHTFSSSCTGDGDFCADTPPTDAPSGCILTTQHCGTLTQVQNVMDYAHCATGWTYDQVARITATLIGMRNALWNSGTCSGTPGNQPPNVSITSPLNGAKFTTVPAGITINASATDVDGTITKVEFYNGSTLLNTDQSSPYSFAWTGVGAGVYSLTAKATDNGNATTTSSVISITVGAGNPVTCTLISPANNSTYTTQNIIKFEATVTGTVSKVEMYWDNVLLVPISAPPYILYLSGTNVGTHTAKAKAFDNSGAAITSNVNTVVISNVTNPPPTVSITTNGTTFNAPASITISATATDNTGISKVEFYNGNTLLNSDNTSPYSFNWTNVSAGSYALTARAYDTQNASAVSNVVNVTVTGGDSPIIKTTLLNNGALKFDAQDGRTRTIP